MELVGPLSAAGQNRPDLSQSPIGAAIDVSRSRSEVEFHTTLGSRLLHILLRVGVELGPRRWQGCIASGWGRPFWAEWLEQRSEAEGPIAKVSDGWHLSELAQWCFVSPTLHREGSLCYVLFRSEIQKSQNVSRSSKLGMWPDRSNHTISLLGARSPAEYSITSPNGTL